MSVLLALMLLIPLCGPSFAALLGLCFFTRWTRRRTRAPRNVLWVANWLFAFAAVLWTMGVGLTIAATSRTAATIENGEPSQKARVFAEGMAEAMNLLLPALLVAIAGLLWLWFAAWKWRRSAADTNRQ